MCHGILQGYAFAEYSLPGDAQKAKDELENRFRQEFQAQQAKKATARLQPAEAAKPAGDSTAQPASEGAEAAEPKAEAEVKAEGDTEMKTEEAAAEPAAEAEAQQEPKTEEAAGTDDLPAGQVKIVRAEFSNIRSVFGLYARNLYIANLPFVSGQPQAVCQSTAPVVRAHARCMRMHAYKIVYSLHARAFTYSSPYSIFVGIPGRGCTERHLWGVWPHHVSDHCSYSIGPLQRLWICRIQAQ